VGGRRAQGKDEEGRIWWKHFVFMYENRTIIPVKTVLRSGEEGERKKDEGEESN
jgi:hypothetical protein